ncbi:MAG: M48 family metallopeptidase [Burkholderiales bacterium]
MATPVSFFQQQHLARRNSRVMVVLFLLATACVITAVDLVVAAIYAWQTWSEALMSGPRTFADALAKVPLGVHITTGVITAFIIFLVSAINVTRLGGGGAALARMVGGRRVGATTREPLERRLVNIVEEMAIAAGVRVPGIYIMDEERGINAFAAGWDISNCIVAVTRGALETLSRDELQAVIGHEFSHIVNGDMRLNIRMIGVLAGIVFIGSIGQFLMRSSRDSDGKSSWQLYVFGLLLFIVGYIGVFFARLIKAAVSRQREYLADASSVQFTRNPDGIAGALDQMRTAAAGSAIAGRYAEEISHMFFGQAVRVHLASLFDTHPPLEERIRRAQPQFVSSEYRRRRAIAAATAATEVTPLAEALAAGPAAIRAAGRREGDIGVAWGRSAAESASIVGALEPAKMDYAARLLKALPEALRASLREPDGARAAIIALLLAPKDEVMRVQLEALRSASLGALADRAATLVNHTHDLGPMYHLAVVDLALPVIKSTTDWDKQDLLRAIEAVINADRRVSLHEFVMLTLVRQQLAPGPATGGMRRLPELKGEVRVLLSVMAHAGTRTDAIGARAAALQAAMAAGAAEMGLPEEAAHTALTLDVAENALAELTQLAPLEKARLVKGLFATVTADGTIRVIEAELMRLVGAVLDCPLPPLIDEIDPATLAP